ncbi:MAG: WG repeat-containing protein [Acidobacteriota bacterium]
MPPKRTRRISRILLIFSIITAILLAPAVTAAPKPVSILTPATAIVIPEDGQTVYLSPKTHDVWCVLDNGTVVTLGNKYFDSFFNAQGYEKIFKARNGERFGKFSEGLAPAGNKIFGFIDTTGSYAIPPQYDAALEFSEGLAAVSRTVYGDI